jgi:hypothetical protein
MRRIAHSSSPPSSTPCAGCAAAIVVGGVLGLQLGLGGCTGVSGRLVDAGEAPPSPYNFPLMACSSTPVYTFPAAAGACLCQLHQGAF